MKNCYNAVDGTFYDAIIVDPGTKWKKSLQVWVWKNTNDKKWFLTPRQGCFEFLSFLIRKIAGSLAMSCGIHGLAERMRHVLCKMGGQLVAYVRIIDSSHRIRVFSEKFVCAFRTTPVPPPVVNSMIQTISIIRTEKVSVSFSANWTWPRFHRSPSVLD